MKQIIILLFSISLLSSCGSRKVVIEEVKKDSLSQISTKIVTDEVVKTETKNNVVTDEFTITPLDTCKDIVVNGIKYKNVVLKYKKTKDNSLHTEQKKVSKKEDKKQITKVEVKEDKKKVERESNPFLPFLWLLIPIIIYILWRNKPSLL
jgi:hypothetical protein